jgi:two-component system chemotaxis sensor kinase CheA
MSADAYPGVVLAVTSEGIVRTASAGLDAPLSIDGAVGRPLHTVLGLADDAAETGTLQLWLACVGGASAEMWRQARRDPPAAVTVGRTQVALDYGATLDGDEIREVVVFIRAQAERTRVTAGFAAVAVEIAADPRTMASFLQSASDLLMQCDAAAGRIATDREARTALHRLFRAVHTIKGEAQSVDQRSICDAAHAVEDVLAELRLRDRPVTGIELDRVERGLEGLRAAIAEVAAGAGSGGDAMTALHRRIRPQITRMQRCLERTLTRPRVRRYLIELHRMALEIVELAESAQLRGFAGSARGLATMLGGACLVTRVPRSTMAHVEQLLDHLDLALGLYQEIHLEVLACESGPELVLMLGRTRRHDDTDVADLAATLASHGVLAPARALERDHGVRAPLVPMALDDAPAMFAPASSELDAPKQSIAARLLRTAAEHAFALESATDVPAAARRIRSAISAAEGALDRAHLDDLAAPLASAGRTLAAQLGKQVSISVDAAGVSVPTAQRRAIEEMAIHAIRNAIDHGIELPEDRIAVCKPATARIAIRVDGDDQRVTIDITDDGRGIDLDLVCARAIEQELLTPGEAARATPEQLLALLFEPGFSTRTAVTMVSGRGVGMDAILSTARELGGDATITSSPGRGTRLRIDLSSPAR